MKGNFKVGTEASEKEESPLTKMSTPAGRGEHIQTMFLEVMFDILFVDIELKMSNGKLVI